jgi:hypothetical protein
MTHWRLIFCVLLGVALRGNSQVGGVKEASPLRLMLSEVQPGTMSSEHYCMLVFADHRFHAEKASRGAGQDRERRVYEGDLSDREWNVLDGILESDGFRKLNVPRTYVPLAVQGAHFVTISVRREKGFQNMEFMDDNSRKPYDSQLKPLFHWWKSARSTRMAPSEAPADSRCKLDSSRGVFSY